MYRRGLYLEMHPRDELEIGVALSPVLLATGEVVETVTIEATPEASAVGVVVEPRPPRQDQDYGLIGYAVLSVDQAQRDHARWGGYGHVVPIRVTVATSLDRVYVRDLQVLIARRAGHPTAARVVVLGD